MKTLVLVAAALAALPAVARADADADADRDAIKQILAAQAKAIAWSDPAGLSATLAPDAIALLPGSFAGCAKQVPAAAAVAWPRGEHAVATAGISQAVIGKDGAVAWATATLAVGKDSLRLTELFTKDGAAWKARALMVSGGHPDAPIMDIVQLEGADVGGDKPAAGSTGAWLAKPAELATHLRAGDDVIVLGSAAGERGAGAAAAKLLASWKSLTFDVNARAGGDGNTFQWTAAMLTRSAKHKGQSDDLYAYWALALAVKGAKGWDVVGVHFSQDPPIALGTRDGAAPVTCD